MGKTNHEEVWKKRGESWSDRFTAPVRTFIELIIIIAIVGILVAFILPRFLHAMGANPQSGTKMVAPEAVQTGPDGHTIEQSNIRERIKADNTPGAIKHLYVISAYSGQVLIYSTVKGKVTSSGKRLTPDKVAGTSLFTLTIGGSTVLTDQIIGEDGVFGHSIEYLYWWDVKGIYHQHYVTGGQILHVSSQPIPVKGVVINMELTK